jgi:hypothetical protein
MILDETIKIRWFNRIIRYYTNLGYDFTKLGDEFEVKIEDLSKSSNVKINVKCDVCGNEKLLIYNKYIKNINNGGYYACSNKCAINKNTQTNLKLYNVVNVFQSEEIKLKIKDINLKLYGVENPQQNKKIRDQTEQTNIKIYGFKNAMQNKIVKEKRKLTYKDKTGFENPGQVPIVKEKRKLTYFNKTGFEYPGQDPVVQEKIKKLI